MVGQFKQLEWLSELAPVSTQFGWETSILRRKLKLAKNKEDKSAQTQGGLAGEVSPANTPPETHANDGLALAASHFIKYESFHTSSSHGHRWNGAIQITSAPFRVIARPNFYRRQLHFENPDSNKPNPSQYRKRKGGTVTPFGLRSGDLVRAEKAGIVYLGWIGGYTESEKTKNVSIYDVNWKRIGQFSPKKVGLLKRSTKLCIAS